MKVKEFLTKSYNSYGRFTISTKTYDRDYNEYEMGKIIKEYGNYNISLHYIDWYPNEYDIPKAHLYLNIFRNGEGENSKSIHVHK